MGFWSRPIKEKLEYYLQISAGILSTLYLNVCNWFHEYGFYLMFIFLSWYSELEIWRQFFKY